MGKDKESSNGGNNPYVDQLAELIGETATVYFYIGRDDDKLTGRIKAVNWFPLCVVVENDEGKHYLHGIRYVKVLDGER